jgi:hypothetical protein
MALLPVGKVVYVCDEVVADPDSHEPSILNLWEVVRGPPGAYLVELFCEGVFVAARLLPVLPA